MAKIDRSKVSKAIQVCLQRCYNQPGQFLPVIAEFVDLLRASGVWNDAELSAVEGGVRKILVFGVLDGATYPGDATNVPPGDMPSTDSKAPKLSGA